MSQEYEGGCLCGRTRFRARGPASNLCICHCSSCRRASGAPFVAWGTFDKSGFAYTSGQAASHRSSDPVWRCFCPSCGTALTYENAKRPAEIDVALALLDDPAQLVPECHIWTAEKLPWIVPGDGLPQYPGWKKPAAS